MRRRPAQTREIRPTRRIKKPDAAPDRVLRLDPDEEVQEEGTPDNSLSPPGAAPAPRPLSGTITAMQVQEHDRERVNVFLDGRFAFGLSAAVLVDAGLRVKDVLDASRVASLLESESRRAALAHAYLFLSYRSRTEQELRRYLVEKGYPSGILDTTLEKLRSQHYVDDGAFAVSWVENRQRFRPRGARLLRTELAQKGVDRGVVDQAIEDAGADERALARDVAEKRAASLPLDDYGAFSRKLGGLLLRRGFSSEVVWDVVRETWVARSGDAAPSES